MLIASIGSYPKLPWGNLSRLVMMCMADGNEHYKLKFLPAWSQWVDD